MIRRAAALVLARGWGLQTPRCPHRRTPLAKGDRRKGAKRTKKVCNLVRGSLLLILAAGAAAGQTTPWTGNSGTAWTVSSNWTDGVPDQFTEAVIPVTILQPVVSSDEQCGGLVVEASATLEITNGNALTNTGNVDVEGVIDGLGTFVLEGLGVLGGAGSIDTVTTEFSGSILLDPTGDVSIGGNVFVSRGVLAMTTGSLPRDHSDLHRVPRLPARLPGGHAAPALPDRPLLERGYGHGRALNSPGMSDEPRDDTSQAETHGFGELGDDAPPREVGDFRILREVGRGGMGIVYEAEQISLGRTVALKTLPQHLSLDERAVERFRREASAAGKLNHPNIAEVHSIGVTGGFHYFAMEFLRGLPVDKLIYQLRSESPKTLRNTPISSLVRRHTGDSDPSGAKPSSSSGTPKVEAPRGGFLESAVDLMIQVGEALSYAHEHGVIHRDVKPSNIVIRSDGVAVLTDFGLAREEGLPHVTQTGEFAGTPRYVSPEQAMARRVKVDHRSDLFSLGVTLYELLTFQPAFTGETSHEVLSKILTKEPQAPNKLNPALPADLVTIVLKAMEKDPDRRYQSAAELVADLRAFRELRPIRARRASPVARLSRWTRREPLKAALVAVLLVTLPVMGYLATKLRAQEDELRAGEARVETSRLAERVEDGYLALAEEEGAVALAAFAEVLAMEPDNGAAVIGKVMTLRAMDESEEGLAVLDDAKGLTEREFDALRLDLLRSVGETEAADELEASLGEPETALELSLLGRRILGTAGNDADLARQALSYLHEAALIAPKRRALYYCDFARAASFAGDADAASDAANALASLWPDRPTTWYFVGMARMVTDRAAAIEAFERCLAERPNYPRALIGLGVALTDSDPERSIDVFDKAAALADDVAEVHFNRGVAFLKLDKLAEAEEAFRDALERNRDFHKAKVSLANIHKRREEYKTALRMYEEVLPHAPDDPLLRANLALSLMKTPHRFEEAIEHWDAAIASSVRPVSAFYFYRQKVFAVLGQTKERTASLEDWRLALPEDELAWNESAWVLIDPDGDPAIRDPETALRWAQRAVGLMELRGDNADVLDTYAEALFLNDRAGEAAEAEERALAAVGPDDPRRPGLEANLERYRAAE